MRRILFITPLPPYPPTAGGGRQRTNLILRALQRVGRVDTLILNDPGSLSAPEHCSLEDQFGGVTWVTPLRRGERGLWRFIRPLKPRMIDRLAHNLGRRSVDNHPDPRAHAWLCARLAREDYDVIVARYLPAAMKTGAFDSGVPVVVDVDDLETQVYRSRLQVPGLRRLQRVAIKHHLRQIDRLVPRWLSRAAHLWLSSEDDRPLVAHPSVSVLPNIPFNWGEDVSAGEPFPQAPADCHVVLAVGSMTHRVNVNAIDRFTRCVWPRVVAAVPDAVLRIAGAGMSNTMRRRWAAVRGVEPIGYLEDIAQAYWGCAFTIAPLFEGGGTKIKVLESLRFGRAVVATDHACRGYDNHLPDRQAIWIARDEDGLTDGCVQLLGDPALRHAMAREGHARVKEYFSLDRFERVVAETFELPPPAG